MESIAIRPEELCSYFVTNQESLKGSSNILAENDEYGTEIYISSAPNGRPVMSVLVDGMEIEELELSMAELEDTAKLLYKEYLSEDFLKGFIDSGDEELEIEERESDLETAVADCLITFVPNHRDFEDFDNTVSHIVDKICEILFTDCGISVYRPMVLEDEDGNEEYLEFPYPELDF